MSADILIIAIPDEIQQKVYERQIQPNLRSGQVLDFASSYSIHFKCIVPPKDVDVVMMSPRAMGVTVRESFVEGKSVPGFVAVAQDASGGARGIVLALARAVGCTRAGVMECTFANEADVNLFGGAGALAIAHPRRYSCVRGGRRSRRFPRKWLYSSFMHRVNRQRYSARWRLRGYSSRRDIIHRLPDMVRSHALRNYPTGK